MKKCLLIILIPVLSLAQPMIWEPQGIPVDQDGRLLPIPFTGGMTDSKPEFVDIDGDGDYDVFIGDNSGKLWYFENVGDSLNPVWEFVSDFMIRLMWEWQEAIHLLLILIMITMKIYLLLIYTMETFIIMKILALQFLQNLNL